MSNLWKDVQFEWAESTPGNALSSEFRLARFKSITRNISKEMYIALGLQALFLAFTDWIISLTEFLPRFV
jgi:hypothetical protein